MSGKASARRREIRRACWMLSFGLMKLTDKYLDKLSARSSKIHTSYFKRGDLETAQKTAPDLQIEPPEVAPEPNPRGSVPRLLEPDRLKLRAQIVAALEKDLLVSPQALYKTFLKSDLIPRLPNEDRLTPGAFTKYVWPIRRRMIEQKMDDHVNKTLPNYKQLEARIR